MSKQAHEPAFRAFSVVEREGRDPFWQPLGAAFENSGGGYNIILQALPLPQDGVCKIVLRPPKEDQPTDERQRDRGRTSSSERDRRR